jgi:hypothetical protein
VRHGFPRFALFLLLSLFPAVWGQLSPGKLAQAHKGLEGLTRCTQCHELGKPIDGSRCLACHVELDARIKARKGYHAQDKVRARSCVSCHSDHHGADFKMVFWDKGQAAFPHAETGWELKGRHAEIKCRDCHRRELAGRSLRAGKGLDPARTLLGLDSRCAACHRDEHQGQLGDDCGRCHGVAAWKPATFDHDQARYPLEGEHRRVACGKCHRNEVPRAKEAAFVIEKKAGGLAARFKPLAFSRCMDCHQDPHQGRLGADCAQCHSTAGFLGRHEGFDHDRTRYPLTGAHTKVDCAKCHQGAEPARSRPPRQDCVPCHKDPHGGQLTGKGRVCGDCHDTERFTPSGFGVARHQQGPAPLAGAHQAVACGDCHTRPAPGEPARYRLGGRAFSGEACADCHQDAHEGQARPWQGAQGCLACHGLEDWRVASWNHDQAQFRLAGRHAQVDCGKCHRGSATIAVKRPLKGLEKDCAACHRDPHRGQFLADAARPDCARCHSSDDWKASHFSHDSARYPLDGQHKDVACAGCHKSERDAEGEFTRYRPLGVRCEDCHGATSPGD